MECSLVIKEWKVELDQETKKPKIAGTYGVMMGGKEIASEPFNVNSYSGKKLNFSPEVIAAADALDKSLRAELEKII